MTNIENARTPFGFSTTADEVLAGVDLSGKRAIVTGGHTGIGLATTKALANAGAEVTIATRNVARAQKTVDQLNTASFRGNILVSHLDLSDLDNVKSYADSSEGTLDILVNNAGIMALPTKEVSPQGFEMQFAVNHLGHFALALALHDALTLSPSSRVVSVSSQAHSFAPIDFDDINFEKSQYDPTLAYCQSKTANALFAVAAAASWNEDGIYGNAVTPGAIRTDLQNNLGGFTVELPPEMIKTPEQGAASSIVASASPLIQGVTGGYFANCNPATLTDVRLDDMTGVLPFAIDPETATQLWEVSLEMIRR